MSTRSAGLLALAALALNAAGAPAATPERYYGANDFAHVRKIDAHVHLHGPSTLFMAQAARDNFRVLTINVDYPDFPLPAEQLKDAVSLREHYPGRPTVVSVSTYTPSADRATTTAYPRPAPIGRRSR